MAPYFSLILPVYNVEKYIVRCVQSILCQQFSDYEVILVDDGSTDRSGVICDDFRVQDSRVQVIHKENGGLSSARNAGLAQAKGEYIWFIDSDDWIAPDSLQMLYQNSSQEMPDVIKFNYSRVTETDEPILSVAKPGVYTGKDIEVYLSEKAFYSAGRYCLSAWSHIYRATFLKQNKLSFVSERLVCSEDYLFNLKAMVQAEKIVVLAGILYYYELRTGSLSQSYKKDRPERYGRLFCCLTEYYQQFNVLEKYKKMLAGFYLWHLIRGTCMPYEYYYSECNVRQKRKNVKTFLADPLVKKAYQMCDLKAFSFKKRIQLFAMRIQYEPLFYWLFLKKKTRRKRNLL